LTANPIFEWAVSTFQVPVGRAVLVSVAVALIWVFLSVSSSSL
jgi:hypothetical protein